MTCPVCGLPVKDGDRHAAQTVDADGTIRVICQVKDWPITPAHWRLIAGRT